MKKKKLDAKQMIADVRDHPFKAYFKYPLGLGVDDIRLRELADSIVETCCCMFDLVLVIILLIWQRLIRNGLLRPFYKAYCVYKNHRKLNKNQKDRAADVFNIGGLP